MTGNSVANRGCRAGAGCPRAPGVPVLDVLHTSIDQDGHPYEATRFVMRAGLAGLFYDIPVE